MDPLSLTASIASVLSLAVGACQSTYDFVSQTRNAPESIRSLHGELVSLQRVLLNLRLKIIENPDISVLFAGRASAVLERANRDTLQECSNDLKSLKTALEEAMSSKIRLMRASISWPFKESQTAEKVQRIRRYNDVLQAAVSIDTFTLAAASLHSLKTLEDESNQVRNSKIMRWLSPLSFASKQRDAFSQRSSNTCSWLLEDASFGSWVEGKASPILWCPGEPGAGKTIAASIVIDYLQRRCSSTSGGLAYLYCDYNSRGDQVPASMLGSLIQQLVVRIPGPAPSTVMNAYNKSEDCDHLDNVEDARDILAQTCSDERETFLVIDALDEIDNQPVRYRRDIINALLKVTVLAPKVRILVTSRHHLADINEAFQKTTKIVIRANDNDVRDFVVATLNDSLDLRDLIPKGSAIEDRIISTVIERAGGQFLLPKLHLGRLCELTCTAEIEESLEDLTVSIEKTYRQTMIRVAAQPESRKDLAMQTLMWLSHAMRPMQFLELREALAIRPTSRKLDQGYYRYERLILESCLGLVKREEGELRLLHYTLQEFLQQQRDFFEISHSTITAKLLSYLQFDWDRPNDTETRPEGFQPDSLSGEDRSMCHSPQPLNREAGTYHKTYPLGSYAFQHWIDHAKLCQESSLTFLLAYFSRRPRTVRIPDGPGRIRVELQDVSPELENWVALVYSVLCGLPIVAKKLIEKGASATNFIDSVTPPTILSWATRYLTRNVDDRGYVPSEATSLWVNRMVEFLVKDKDFVPKASKYDQKHLGLLLPCVSSNVRKLIVQGGHDVNQTFAITLDVNGTAESHAQNPLSVAIACASDEVVSLLISQGAYLDFSSEDEAAPLWQALLYWSAARNTERERIVQGSLNWSATRSTHRERIVQGLLNAGADPTTLINPRFFIRYYHRFQSVNSSLNRLSSTLHFAVAMVSPRMVAALVKAKADINVLDANELTPLALLFGLLCLSPKKLYRVKVCNIAQMLASTRAVSSRRPITGCASCPVDGCGCLTYILETNLDRIRETDSQEDVAARGRYFKFLYGRWKQTSRREEKARQHSPPMSAP